MSESQKSTVSTTENLDITFASGENLNITTTKCVTLNLQLDESNKDSYSDQTPTPTRFIRNCEEVGLFQDLQNVNPFDETFKKAVELTKIGTLHVPDASTDDTLHTPHILPHEVDSDTYKQGQCIFNISRVPSLDEDLLKLAGSGSKEGEILDKLCGNKGQETLDSTFSISRVPSIDEDLLIIANDDSDTERDVCPSENNKNKENKECHQADTNKALKMKIKEAVQNRLKNENRTLKLLDSGQGIIIAPVNIEKVKNAQSATLLINQRPDPSIVTAPRKRAANHPSTTKRARTVPDETSPEKEKVREMNRIAQSKSRTRKKHWISDMQKRIEELSRENKNLLVVNELLKGEVNLMRSILQYHSNCSATKDPEIKQKVDQLMAATSKQKTQQKNAPVKRKAHIPIRPHPVAPLKIEMPVIRAVPNNVQLCVVPMINTRPLIQMTSVTVDDGIVRPVMPKPN